MSDHTYVILDGRLENIRGIAAEGLPGKLQKPILGRGNDVLNRESGVIYSVFASHKILRNQRTVHPRQHVIMQRVHLAESRAHLAAFCDKASRQRREGDKSFFQIDARFAKGYEEVTARFGMVDGFQPTSDSCISNVGVGLIGL